MNHKRSFDKNYLNQEFDKLNTKTKQSITLFLIGEGAMAFYGLKEATKDIDIILTNTDDLENLKTTLKAIGYKEPEPALITRAYNYLQTNAILENQDGFRWDLFLNKVCNALTLSATMKQRATQLYKGERLTVFVASKEDIFLFKGITERETDLEDMRILAESGLNWNIINQECQNQSTSTGRLWENALYQKLTDLREKHHIEAPIEKTLRKRAEEKLIEITLIEEIKKGNNTVNAISKSINEPEHFVRESLNKLARKRLIKIDKTHRPHRYLLKTQTQKHATGKQKATTRKTKRT